MSPSCQATVVSRPSTGGGMRGAQVDEHERAGAVGVLGHAGREARLAEQRGLLVAGDARRPAPRSPAARSGSVIPNRPLLGRTSGRHERRHAEELEQLVGPRTASMSKSMVRLAFDGSVACTPVRFHSTQESTVPNARSASASTPPSREQPLELGGGEVRVEHEPGARPHERLDAGHAQVVAARRGAAVLPHDGPVAGPPGATGPTRRPSRAGR